MSIDNVMCQPINSYDKCAWCGNPHISTICPLVKSMEYFENGTLRKVEFKESARLVETNGIDMIEQEGK